MKIFFIAITIAITIGFISCIKQGVPEAKPFYDGPSSTKDTMYYERTTNGKSEDIFSFN